MKEQKDWKIIRIHCEFADAPGIIDASVETLDKAGVSIKIEAVRYRRQKPKGEIVFKSSSGKEKKPRMLTPEDWASQK